MQWYVDCVKPRAVCSGVKVVGCTGVVHVSNASADGGWGWCRGCAGLC